MPSYNIFDKLKTIKMLILDVDGVMTTGEIGYHTGQNLSRGYNVKDGVGIILLREYGILTAIITGKLNELAERRAKALGICEVMQGFPHKTGAFDRIIEKYGLEPHECAFIGDDAIDVEVMKRAGFAVSVADGHAIAKRNADYVTRNRGGKGAVRELCDMILAFRTANFTSTITFPNDDVHVPAAYEKK